MRGAGGRAGNGGGAANETIYLVSDEEEETPATVCAKADPGPLVSPTGRGDGGMAAPQQLRHPQLPLP